MTIATLVLKNLTRNPGRTLLTVLAVMLPMALFCMTAALRNVFDEIAKKSAAELRIGVHHKVSLINLVPSSGRKKIEALDPEGKIIADGPDPLIPGNRLKAVCSMRWFGGEVKNTQFRFPSLAGDPDTLPIVYEKEVDFSDEERKAWLADRRAAVVGTATAAAFGWTTGQEVELTGTVPPYLAMRFKIVKITDRATNPAIFYFRLDYLREMYETVRLNGGIDAKPDRVNIFWAKCKDPARMGDLMRMIDEEFANSPDETQSEDENAFFANFTKAGGDFPGKIQIVGMAVVLAIVMVVANTMSLTFRERTRELAAFKALGFPSGRIVGMVMAESIILAGIGGLMGILPLFILTQAVPLRIIPNFPVPIVVGGATLVLAGLVTLAVGVLAGAVPAWQAQRLKVVDALRKLG